MRKGASRAIADAIRTWTSDFDARSGELAGSRCAESKAALDMISPLSIIDQRFAGLAYRTRLFELLRRRRRRVASLPWQPNPLMSAVRNLTLDRARCSVLGARCSVLGARSSALGGGVSRRKVTTAASRLDADGYPNATIKEAAAFGTSELHGNDAKIPSQSSRHSRRLTTARRPCRPLALGELLGGERRVDEDTARGRSRSDDCRI